MTREAVVATEEAEAPPIVARRPAKSARVKGTWTLYFGLTEWDFVDGKRYDLPIELFNYLKQHGNIYDTL